MGVAMRAAEILRAAPPAEVITKGGLARLLGCDPAMITRHCKSGRLAQALRPDGKLDLVPALRGLVAGAAGEPPPAAGPVQDMPPAPADPGEESLHAARTRKEIAAANAREMAVAERAGRLIDRDAAMTALVDRLAVVRQSLLSLPHRLADALAAEADPNRTRLLLEAEVHTMLSALHQEMTTYARDHGAQLPG